MALTMPRPSATAATIQTVTTPVTVRIPSSSASPAAAEPVQISVLRLSKRSAMRPPQGPINNTGSICRAMTMPRMAPLSDSLSTSQACATLCIQVPLTETIWPKKKKR